VARTIYKRHFERDLEKHFERHLERHIIPSKKERGKEITIKSRNIIFNLGCGVKRSILINILIKNTILEWCVIIFYLFIFFIQHLQNKQG
jgi:hypothetical protein